MDVELADWMQAGDLKFLRYLGRHEGELIGPSTIAKNTKKNDGSPYSRDYVWRRLQDLSESGLIVKEGRGDYRITVEGTKYLSGDIGPEDVEIDESIEDSD